MNLDITVHLGELLLIAGIAWKAIRTLNRLDNALENFPLHRHLGKRIIYPSTVDVDAGDFETQLNGESHGARQ